MFFLHDELSDSLGIASRALSGLRSRLGQANVCTSASVWFVEIDPMPRISASQLLPSQKKY